jgi:hypothetical protein
MFGFGPHALKGAVQKVPPVAEDAKTDGGGARTDKAPVQPPESKDLPVAAEQAAKGEA